MPEQIIITGCGPGGREYLTRAAEEAVAGADVLAGAPGLLGLFPDFPGQCLVLAGDIPGFLRQLEGCEGIAVVLVSGDPGLFSLSRRVLEHFGTHRCRIIPGISSLQIACARLALDWEDTRIVSLHAQADTPSVQELLTFAHIALFAGNGTHDAQFLALHQALRAGYRAVLCQDLTLPGERICELAEDDPSPALGSGRKLVVFIRKHHTA